MWFVLFSFYLFRGFSLRSLGLSNLPSYLSKNQWKHIQTILQHPQTTPSMKTKVNQVLFQYYRGWAIYQANLFYKTHWKHAKNIRKRDLILYSLLGLHKAIQTYCPQYKFASHAKIYISGFLYQGLTDLQPLNNVPKHYRKRSAFSQTRFVNTNTNAAINQRTSFLGDEHWRIDKYLLKLQKDSIREKENQIVSNYAKLHEYKQIWDIVETMDPASKRIYFLRYNYQFQKIRNISKVAELMCASEEWIRLKMIQSKQHIAEKMQEAFNHV